MCKLKKRYNDDMKRACQNTIYGCWSIGENLSNKELLKYIKWLGKDKRVADFEVCDDYIDINLYLDFCPNAEIDEEDE